MSKLEDCESCGFEAKLKDCFDGKFRLCSLCAGTLTGNAMAYPAQYEHSDVMKTICYVGNVLLAEIKKQRTR